MNTKERLYLYVFLLSFCTFIISPSILVLMEDQADVAYFFNAAEEEEKKEEGKEKDMKEHFIFAFPKADIAFIQAEVKGFYYLQEFAEDLFHDPLLPPPEICS